MERIWNSWVKNALEVQIQEYYVTNTLTKNNKKLWTVFNFLVHLETVQEGKY